MKDISKRLEFVELRAQGLSLRKIAEKIGIADKTCERWERELTEQINARKSELSNEIVAVYETAKEARIKRLNETLDKLYAGLEKTDFSNMPPDKLLKYTLAYEQQLKAEQTEVFDGFELGTGSEENIMTVCAQIFREQASGALSGAAATALYKSLSKVVGAVQNVENQNPLGDMFSLKNDIEL